MCGIVGWITSQPIPEEILEKMVHSLHHRGPDDQGWWQGSVRNIHCALGSTRLSILDLSPQGHMPMATEDQRYWIVYNGEVYNFREIREHLKKEGYRFRSKTDTEVILKAYQAWGKGMVSRLWGMFAFAIWDNVEGTLFLARDRMGKKPLYFARWDANFSFASEIKALYPIPGFPKDIDLKALYFYLMFRMVPAPYSIYQTIKKLPQGCYGFWKEGSWEIHRYWDIPLGENNPYHGLPLQEKERLLWDLLDDAVKRRTIADVPLGALLSSGIDSTLISHFLTHHLSEPLKTFTIGVQGMASYDESRIAEKTAKRLGTDHHTLILSPTELQESFQTVLAHMDEPVGSSSFIPTYWVSKLAREYVTVALSGDGPDEIFGGYRAYLLESFYKIARFFPSWVKGAVAHLPASDGSLIGRFIRRIQRGFGTLRAPREDRFFHLTHKFQDYPLRQILKDGPLPSFEKEGKELFSQLLQRCSAEDPINQMLYVDTKLKLADHILYKVDLMSMMVSLEVRCPFLDHRIVELAFSLPGPLKVHGFQKKYFLKKVFHPCLPRHVVHKPKRGFEIPVGEWLKGPLKKLFEDVVFANHKNTVFSLPALEKLFQEHLSGKRDHGEKLYILFALKSWAHYHHVTL